ncbi:hypothetical protein [Streptomyces sp. 147326]|uniref:preATP grasp domain-containing protein n=1 Tax=Streptomyces sp. 147326 TaxID=3074379 RepID=UPI003857D270
MWLLRPGDVLVIPPVPSSREFLRYAYDLTGVTAETAAVVAAEGVARELLRNRPTRHPAWSVSKG